MIRLRGISFSYTVKGKAIPVLEDVDADFGRGKITAIVGPSGSGKTSLLRLLCGLSEPDSGEIRIDGEPGGSVRAKTALIFQDFGLLPWETVEGNAELGLVARGIGKRERRYRVGPVLEELGLSAFSSTYPARLSGGMRQRVALARALVSDADLLLMDEPFSSLDAITREALQDGLLETQSRHGTTVILVTHSIEEAAYLADEVYMLSGRNPSRLLGPFRSNWERRDTASTENDQTLSACPEIGREPESGSPRRESPEYYSNLSALRRVFFGSATRAAASSPSDAAPAQPAHIGNSVAKPLARLALKLLKTAAAALILIAFWHAAALLVSKPFLPSPFSVFGLLVEGFLPGSSPAGPLPNGASSAGSLWLHLWASLKRVLGALVAAGPIAWFLGLLSGRSPKADALASPAIYLLHPLPKVAFLPVLMLFLGLGDASKIALMGLVIFGQLFVGARDAARSIQPSLLDTSNSLGAGPGFRFWRVVFPSSLPALLSSTRVALGSALAVLFLAETFASMDGLGWYIMDSWSRVDYPAMYSAITALAGLGLGLYLALDFLAASLLGWRDSGSA
ncbi:MAG TPA: ATP-binding cassette domain-containing protein [Rectinemataceae bacterium]